MHTLEKTGQWVEPDPSQAQYSTGHSGWRLIEHDTYLQVQDPVLGDFAIGNRPEDEVIREIVMSPLGLRAFSIPQLSKLREHAPIPNIYDFFRAGHALNNVEGVNRLACQHPGRVTPRQMLLWKTEVAKDDLAHGLGSHLTDMIIEGGYGGPEDAHEKRSGEAERYGGVRGILQAAGIRLDAYGKIRGLQLPPWIEVDAPDLCYERYGYTVEETRLAFSPSDDDPAAQRLIETIADMDNLVITEDAQLAFRDEEVALMFSKAYLLLSTEDWNEPVNRVIEHLLIEGFKHAVYSRRLPNMKDYDNGHTADVASYTYGIDQDLLQALSTSRNDRDDFMFALSQLLSQIAKEERWRFVEYKRGQFLRFLLDERAEAYPSAILNGHVMDYGPPSSVVEIKVEKGEAPRQRRPRVRANAAQLIHVDSGGVQYSLQPMKNRYVDPLVMTATGPKPLSRINETYRSLLRQHAIIHASKVAVRLAVTGEYENLVHEVVENNAEQARASRPKLKGDQLRWQIDAAAARSVADAQAAGRLVLLER